MVNRRSRTRQHQTGALLVLLGVFMMILSLFSGAAGAAPKVGAAAGNATPGNNGTFKIHDDDTPETDVRNEPHVSCDFDINFFNFDDGQVVIATINAHPPSGSGEQVFQQEITLVSTGGPGAANNP